MTSKMYSYEVVLTVKEIRTWVVEAPDADTAKRMAWEDDREPDRVVETPGAGSCSSWPVEVFMVK